MRSIKRLCCSFFETSSQYFSKMMPWATKKSLEGRTIPEKLPVLFFGAEAHHVFNSGPVIPTPVEDDDFAARGKSFNVALRVDLRPLPFRGRWERYDAKDTRADALHDPFDDATFAGSIPSFKKDDYARVGRLYPLLKRDQFNLQLEHLGFVVFLANLRLSSASSGFRLLLEM